MSKKKHCGDVQRTAVTQPESTAKGSGPSHWLLGRHFEPFRPWIETQPSFLNLHLGCNHIFPTERAAVPIRTCNSSKSCQWCLLDTWGIIKWLPGSLSVPTEHPNVYNVSLLIAWNVDVFLLSAANVFVSGSRQRINMQVLFDCMQRSSSNKRVKQLREATSVDAHWQEGALRGRCQSKQVDLTIGSSAELGSQRDEISSSRSHTEMVGLMSPPRWTATASRRVFRCAGERMEVTTQSGSTWSAGHSEAGHWFSFQAAKWSSAGITISWLQPLLTDELEDSLLLLLFHRRLLTSYLKMMDQNPSSIIIVCGLDWEP